MSDAKSQVTVGICIGSAPALFGGVSIVAIWCCWCFCSAPALEDGIGMVPFLLAVVKLVTCKKKKKHEKPSCVIFIYVIY